METGVGTNRHSLSNPWLSGDAEPTSGSASPEGSQYSNLEELESVTERVAQVVELVQREVAKMQDVLTHTLGIASDLGRRHGEAEQPAGLVAHSSEPYRRAHDTPAAPGVLSQDDANVFSGEDPEAERAQLRLFDPCQNLRLRLELLPSDHDFESLVKDKDLRNVFKQGLTKYVRRTLLAFYGQLSLHELEKTGIAHARYCIRQIATAPQNQKRRLLEFGARQKECKQGGFISGLEETLRQRFKANGRSNTQGISSHNSGRHADQTGFNAPWGSDAPASSSTSSLRRRASSTPLSDSRSNENSAGLLTKQPDGEMPPTLRRRQAAAAAQSPVQRNSDGGAKDLGVQRPRAPGSVHRAYDHSRAGLIRWRELGGGHFHSARALPEQLTREVQSRVLEELKPWRQWGYASKDILNTVWHPGGRYFAIGASANLDSLNQQYNEKNNLLYGDIENNELRELNDHRIDRPRPDEIATGANTLWDFYNTMDPHLYTTVAGICFDKNAERMYTSSYDKMVKIWDISQTKPHCMQTLEHREYVNHLDVSSNSTVMATGQASRSNSIRMYSLHHGTAKLENEFESERARLKRLSPTCLKFGPSNVSNHLLLAGFSENADEGENPDREGELCLWDVGSNPPTRIKLNSASRNVFDVAWHPQAPYFAAALALWGGDPTATRRGIKSYIRTWDVRAGPGRIFEFDCLALDVNELRFCPTRHNYISASCTDGSTYIWDARFPDECLTRLRHQEPIDPIHPKLIKALGYERAREEADTGVRLVAWDNEGRLLYTGSSDGVIKQWNPWVAQEDALLKDVAKFDSGAMAGALSPDGTNLLIGLAKGNVSILSSGPLSGTKDSLGKNEEGARRVQDITYLPAKPTEPEETHPADELVASGQIAVHPILGAGQGPTYAGPYASWARNGVEKSNLASTELDPDVLASQIHPIQWQKGMQAGGLPTRAAEERQKWLAEQTKDQAFSRSEAPKRSRDDVSNSSSPIRGLPTPKRVRPTATPLATTADFLASRISARNERGDSSARPPTSIGVPPINTDPSFHPVPPVRPNPTLIPLNSVNPTASANPGPVVNPSLSVNPSQYDPSPTVNATPVFSPVHPGSQRSVVASSAHMTPARINTLADRTPSPQSTRIKQSPHSYRSPTSSGNPLRPKPKFKMPREPPVPVSLFGQANRQNREEDMEQGRERAREQARKSAEDARGKGELIVLDDDDDDDDDDD